MIPLLAPVADKLGIDLIWFGVLLAVNMQTSFMHPPFGFALFFLRSVAPEKPYVDRVTRKVMEPVTTMQIYRGAVPFLLIQLSMVALLIAFPQLVTGNLDKKQVYNMESIGDQMRDSLPETENIYDTAPAENTEPEPQAEADVPVPEAETPEDDPLKDMQEAVKKSSKK